MSDAIVGALGDVFGFLLNALTAPKAWLAAGLVFGAAATAVFVRGKLAWGLWVPILGAFAYLAWQHFRPY